MRRVCLQAEEGLAIVEESRAASNASVRSPKLSRVIATGYSQVYDRDAPHARLHAIERLRGSPAEKE